MYHGDSLSYIDDIKIESALNIRCSDSGARPEDCVVPTLEDNDNEPQPEFVGPSCRLYPTENALSCSHTDENNITTKGVKGYCLEVDPRNSAVCLLWYPVDRIASDSIEEGGGVNFNDKSVYYCLNAKDDVCSALSPETPQLYCDEFVKVDTSKYWAGRLNEDSSLKLPDTTFPETPFFYPSDTRKIDFGGEVGPINIPPLTRRTTDNYYGSLVQTDSLSSKKKVAVENRNITSFLPYFGTVGGMRCPDNTRYYFVNNRDKYVPSPTFGVELDEGSSSMDLGYWDECSATSAVQADLDRDWCFGNGIASGAVSSGVCRAEFLVGFAV
jgi:hypothetical protein